MRIITSNKDKCKTLSNQISLIEEINLIFLTIQVIKNKVKHKVKINNRSNRQIIYFKIRDNNSRINKTLYLPEIKQIK